MSYFTGKQEKALKTILEEVSVKNPKLKKEIEKHKLLEAIEKSNYMEVLKNDIIEIGSIGNKEVLEKLTSEQIDHLAHIISSKYSYSDYNEYIQHTIEMYHVNNKDENNKD